MVVGSIDPLSPHFSRLTVPVMNPPAVQPPFIPRPHDTIFSGSTSLGSDRSTQLLHLYRGRDLLYVQIRKEHQLKPLPGEETIDERFERESKEDSIVEETAINALQTLLSQLPFGRTNRVFLIKNSGAWRLVDRPMRVSHMPMKDWGVQVVDEREVELTRWITVDRHEGVWNGRPVDLYRPPEEQLFVIERSMDGYVAIRGLGLAFEVVALLAREGHVVGVMTEPIIGRSMRWSDRRCVYEAVAKLQRNGFFYDYVNADGIVITDNGARFLHLQLIKPIPDADAEVIAAEADRRHWRRLKRLFETLRTDTIRPFPVMFRLFHGPGCFIVPWQPSPDRPLGYFIQLCPEFISMLYAVLDAARLGTTTKKAGSIQARKAKTGRHLSAAADSYGSVNVLERELVDQAHYVSQRGRPIVDPSYGRLSAYPSRPRIQHRAVEYATSLSSL